MYDGLELRTHRRKAERLSRRNSFSRRSRGILRARRRLRSVRQAGRASGRPGAADAQARASRNSAATDLENPRWHFGPASAERRMATLVRVDSAIVATAL